MKLILLFFSGMLTISSFAGATNSPVHDAFLKHLDIFLAADATRSYSSSSISAPEFYAKLDQNNLTPEDYHSFLIACANHSMMSAIRPGKAHTDYITDDEVIDVLVYCII